MKDNLLPVYIIGIALVMSSVAAYADVPTLINYQGVLLDSEGDPVTEPANVTFTIYDLPSGGTMIWQEAQLVEFDGNGRFDVSLGEIISITDDVFDDPVRWLGIQVEGDAELEPRTRIVSVAYAHRISTVDGAGGGTISGDVAIQSDLDVSGDIRVTGKATIGSGHTNTGSYAFVVGENNTATGEYSTVSGGETNTASADYATVGGGMQNTASFTYATVAGGINNAATGEWSTVAGGVEDTASGSRSFVGGGVGNTASGPYSIVGGGYHNSATAGGSVVAGGVSDTASGIWSAVGGGQENTASGDWSIIGGGYTNLSSGDYSTVAGGMNNMAGSNGSAVGGGNLCIASNEYSVVAGGNVNTASGGHSAIGGGAANEASGLYSCVPGGHVNAAEGDYSLAAGRKARAYHNGAFVWGDHTDDFFGSTGEDQFLIRASGGVGIGTNDPTSALHVNGEAKCEVGGVEFFMVPRGAIIMWSGLLASIPDGWALCDGSYGTPDLRDRFIYGCSAGEDPGATGGSTQHDHSVDIGPFNSEPGSTWSPVASGSNFVSAISHIHSVDPPPTNSSSSDHLPSYYKLAFIMRL